MFALVRSRFPRGESSPGEVWWPEGVWLHGYLRLLKTVVGFRFVRPPGKRGEAVTGNGLVVAVRANLWPVGSPKTLSKASQEQSERL